MIQTMQKVVAAAPWLATAMMAILALPCSADTAYKWVDKNGNVTYQDEPPPPDARQVEEKPIQGSSLVPDTSDDPAEVARKNPIVLYSVPGCDACSAARIYLEKRGVPFTEYNVEGNPELQKKMKDKVGELAVPTLTVGGKVMKGYVQSVLEGELDAAGYARQAPEGAAAGEAAPTLPAPEAIEPQAPAEAPVPPVQ